MNSSSPTHKGSESDAHRELKKLALIWAQTNGYPIAAPEVSLPNYRVRLDVAAYKPAQARATRPGSPRAIQIAALGTTAILECKATPADFVRDSRSRAGIAERLKVLHRRKEAAEQELKIFYPSIRNGDSLFQEYETLNFERPGYERYQRIMQEIKRLTARLHENTKFEVLIQRAAANLFYLVTPPNLMDIRLLPHGWGLLEKDGPTLALRLKPIWHQTEEPQRLAFLHRIAIAGTRAVNGAHQIELNQWESKSGRQ